MSSERDVNVLLLGESGAGKSTFINSLANYERCKSLQEALYTPLHCPIPVDFTIVDDDYVEHRVLEGADENERCGGGSSTTKEPKEYVFQVRDGVRLRVIDSPGVGDSRGLAQDVENVRRTMEFVAGYGHVNAVVFLLKTNLSVLSEYFRYCVTYLLARLQPAVLANVVFVFTHTRSTFYRPGDTLTVLRRVLQEQRPLHIPCGVANIFCVDNEAFRYLVAYKRGVNFHEHEVTQFASSWLESSAACGRLLDYVVGAGGGAGLKRCRVRLGVNRDEDVRGAVARMEFLADVFLMLNDNNTIAKKLWSAGVNHGEFIFLRGIKGGQAVVCKCSTRNVLVQGIYFQEYATKCHESCNCHMANVHTDLAKCVVFKRSENECLVCSCKWENHSKISYEMATRFQQVWSFEEEIDEVAACLAILCSFAKANRQTTADWLKDLTTKQQHTDKHRYYTFMNLKTKCEQLMQTIGVPSSEDVQIRWEALKKLPFTGEAIANAFGQKPPREEGSTMKPTVSELMTITRKLHNECAIKDQMMQDYLNNLSATINNTQQALNHFVTHWREFFDYQARQIAYLAAQNSAENKMRIESVLSSLQQIDDRLEKTAPSNARADVSVKPFMVLDAPTQSCSLTGTPATISVGEFQVPDPSKAIPGNSPGARAETSKGSYEHRQTQDAPHTSKLVELDGRSAASLKSKIMQPSQVPNTQPMGGPIAPRITSANASNSSTRSTSGEVQEAVRSKVLVDGHWRAPHQQASISSTRSITGEVQEPVRSKLMTDGLWRDPHQQASISSARSPSGEVQEPASPQLLTDGHWRGPYQQASNSSTRSPNGEVQDLARSKLMSDGHWRGPHQQASNSSTRSPNGEVQEPARSKLLTDGPWRALHQQTTEHQNSGLLKTVRVSEIGAQRLPHPEVAEAPPALPNYSTHPRNNAARSNSPRRSSVVDIAAVYGVNAGHSNSDFTKSASTYVLAPQVPHEVARSQETRSDRLENWRLKQKLAMKSKSTAELDAIQRY